MPPKIHGMRKTVIAATLLVVVAVTAVVLVVRGRPPEPAAAPPPAVKTTTVRKGDLANTRVLQANLGFGAARPVKGGTGTVTKLPAAVDMVGPAIRRRQPDLQRHERPHSSQRGRSGGSPRCCSRPSPLQPPRP